MKSEQETRELLQHLRKQKLHNAKCKRNSAIRKMFDDYMNKRLQIEFAVEEISIKYGLSETTIWAIIKRYGYYSNK